MKPTESKVRMMAFFSLEATIETLVIGNNPRLIRVEVFRDLENPKVFRGRVWEKTTYNLYPTFANFMEGGGLQNRVMSCDEINREITTVIADSSEFITGKEWESMDAFVAHAKGLILKYREIFHDNPSHEF